VTLHKLTCDLDDRDAARSLAAALQELVSPGPHALTLFEQPGAEGAPPSWRIEAYYDEAPDTAALTDQLVEVAGSSALPQLMSAPVEDLNWVAMSQAALPPVTAGRFTVHGSHDSGRVARGPNAILIDAGEAFGTAHHATTFGCLSAIDGLTRRRRFRNVLDLGCGSGVLAIAVARALPEARIHATDLDAQSIVVAKDNMRRNGVGARITALVADGLDAPALRRATPFDFVIANILAGPLVALAPDIRRAVVPGGMLVLSGLLVPQASEVIAAYVAADFLLVDHQRVLGWSTLTLVRR
jgi:ribosomal protein L11 methyltransferase